jgi:hypothetical protein
MDTENLMAWVFILVTLLFAFKDYSDFAPLVCIGMIAAYVIGTRGNKK